MTGDSDLRGIGHDPAGAVDVMQEAALERAVVDDSDAKAHLAFAGALEEARPVPAGADPLLLGSVLAVAIESEYGAEIEVGAETEPVRPARPADGGSLRSPLEPDGRRRPVVEGALLAHDRYDLSTETAAALADLTVEAFRAERRR
jgi:hypothetical protein